MIIMEEVPIWFVLRWNQSYWGSGLPWVECVLWGDIIRRVAEWMGWIIIYWIIEYFNHNIYMMKLMDQPTVLWWTITSWLQLIIITCTPQLKQKNCNHIRSLTRTQGMFYPLLRSVPETYTNTLLNLKAAYHMGVKDTEIGCIWVKWRGQQTYPIYLPFFNFGSAQQSSVLYKDDWIVVNTNKNNIF